MPYYEFVCLFGDREDGHPCKKFIKYIPYAESKGMAETALCPTCGASCIRVGFYPVPFIFKEKP